MRPSFKGSKTSLKGSHSQVCSSVGFTFLGYSAVSIVCEETEEKYVIYYPSVWIEVIKMISKELFFRWNYEICTRLVQECIHVCNTGNGHIFCLKLENKVIMITNSGENNYNQKHLKRKECNCSA